MDIQKKFEMGAQNHTYQRVDPEYTVNIFLGYNDDGCMSMVITENGIEAHVKSSKFIEVKMKRREDKKIALSFDLLDEAYKPLFLIFCNDMINICVKAGPEMAISTALIRWKYWKEMFGRRKNKLLDKLEIKGLIGELLVLENYFLKKYDETTAISCWMGPLLGHKDFEIDDTWFEIKTISENATQVIISSLEQLESETDGHLIVVRLEDTSNVMEQGININTLVLNILSTLQDPDNIDLFQTKLDNMGYAIDPDYENYNFLFKGEQRYFVNNEFPRLRRSKISENIANVKYSILLNGLTNFLEK